MRIIAVTSSLVLALATSSCVVEVPESNASGNTASVAPPRDMGAPPELRTKPNGDIEVIFESGCVCIFDRNGKLLMGGRACDDVDLHRARTAVKAHLAEQRSDFLDV